MTRTYADKDSLASILAYINTYLKYNGKQGLLDENKALEDVMCEVLNRIYGWKLENLNHVEKNFPGIDLGDWERGIGVQVTVEKTSSKINNTIAKIVKNEVYNKFPHLKILILGDKQASYSIRNDEKIVFDDEKDIIDFVDLLDVSSRMDFQGRHKLVVFLKQELGWEAENTQLRILTYEKVQKYQEEQHKENSYITILGLHKKLPIQDAWIKLNILTEEELKRKQTETQWDFLNQYDEYSGSHPMSDVSAIAKRELQKIWIAAPNKLEYVIDNFEKLEYDGCIFELILQLPSQITCPYGMALKRLGMEISEEMQLIWLGNLRSLEWISAECMKTMVCESLSDESDAIRNKAMKCWLGEKDFWWENFA